MLPPLWGSLRHGGDGAHDPRSAKVGGSTGHRTCPLSHGCALPPPGQPGSQTGLKTAKMEIPAEKRSASLPEQFSAWEHVAGLS